MSFSLGEQPVRVNQAVKLETLVLYIILSRMWDEALFHHLTAEVMWNLILWS